MTSNQELLEKLDIKLLEARNQNKVVSNQGVHAYLDSLNKFHKQLNPWLRKKLKKRVQLYFDLRVRDFENISERRHDLQGDRLKKNVEARHKILLEDAKKYGYKFSKQQRNRIEQASTQYI